MFIKINEIRTIKTCFFQYKFKELKKFKSLQLYFRFNVMKTEFKKFSDIKYFKQ